MTTKILILHKWLVMGGIEKVLLNYLNLLYSEKNLQIDLIIAFDTEDNVFGKSIPNNVSVNYLFNIEYCKIRDHIYRNRKNNLIYRLKDKLYKVKEKYYCVKKLNNIIFNGNYDLVINFSNHFDPYISFRKLTIPCIRWQHLALKEDYSKNVIKEIKYLKKYTNIIAICNDMAISLANRALLSKDKIITLYNPLNEKDIIERSLDSINKEILSTPYFVQVARLDKIKRHIDLIEIYKELVNNGVKEKLYIIGNGEEYNNLKAFIYQLGLEEHCFLLGDIHNPYPYIRNATLFLHTSEREGLPTVLLESLILNTPIVAMDCPTGPREILDNGKCGGLIALGDKRAFINEVLSLVNNPDKLSSYKELSAKHIQYFSEENIKNKFLTIIKQALSKRNYNE